MGIQLAEHGDVEAPVAVTPEDADAGVDDLLSRFVREMDRLEGLMNFVGYGMLCNQWVLDWGMGWTEH